MPFYEVTIDGADPSEIQPEYILSVQAACITDVLKAIGGSPARVSDTLSVRTRLEEIEFALPADRSALLLRIAEVNQS